jgi:hypothetical protein
MTNQSTLPTTSTPATYAPTAAQGPERTLSIVSFVVGLSSVVLGFTFIAPIAAIVLGFVALGREPEARAFAVWGIALGALMSIGWLIAGVAVLAASPFFLTALF